MNNLTTAQEKVLSVMEKGKKYTHGELSYMVGKSQVHSTLEVLVRLGEIGFSSEYIEGRDGLVLRKEYYLGEVLVLDPSSGTVEIDLETGETRLVDEFGREVLGIIEDEDCPDELGSLPSSEEKDHEWGNSLSGEEKELDRDLFNEWKRDVVISGYDTGGDLGESLRLVGEGSGSYSSPDMIGIDWVSDLSRSQRGELIHDFHLEHDVDRPNGDLRKKCEDERIFWAFLCEIEFEWDDDFVDPIVEKVKEEMMDPEVYSQVRKEEFGKLREDEDGSPSGEVKEITVDVISGDVVLIEVRDQRNEGGSWVGEIFYMGEDRKVEYTREMGWYLLDKEEDGSPRCYIEGGEVKEF